MSWTKTRRVRLGSLFARQDLTGRPDLPMLSVYRDYGVVLRDGRDDNYNKPGENLSAYRVVRRGDLILNKMKTWQGSLGISRYDGIVSPAYFVARPLTGDYSEFLHHLLRSSPLIAEYAARSKGIRPSQWDLPWEEFRNIYVDLPPVMTQRCIADYLHSETARIDALIAAKQRMVALLEERSLAVINKVCPGQIIHGPDGRPIGVKGAQCVRLGAVAAIQNGFTMDSGRNTGDDPITLPYLRVANVQDGSLSLDDVKEVTLPRAIAQRCTLRLGDVLMTEGGDPDKLGRGTIWSGDVSPCVHQNAIFAVRPDWRLSPNIWR